MIKTTVLIGLGRNKICLHCSVCQGRQVHISGLSYTAPMPLLPCNHSYIHITVLSSLSMHKSQYLETTVSFICIYLSIFIYEINRSKQSFHLTGWLWKLYQANLQTVRCKVISIDYLHVFLIDFKKCFFSQRTITEWQKLTTNCVNTC